MGGTNVTRTLTVFLWLNDTSYTVWRS